MARIGIILWAIFLAILAFSIMPKAIVLVMVISFIGGLLDCYLKDKKKKQKEERKRQYNTLKDDFNSSC